MTRKRGGARLQVLLLLLLAVCVGALVTMFVAPPAGSVDRDHDAPGVDPAAVVPDEAKGPAARVHGQVLLEVESPGEPKPAVIVVDGDTAAAQEPEPEPEDPYPDLELVPAEEGSCRIRAWQSGVAVSDVGTCDAEGKFELTLHPGVTGRTAFELEVSGRLRAVVEAEVPDGGTGRLPPVALGFATGVTGQVIDGRGTPKAGVTVEAMPNPNLAEPEPWRATTDAEGNFTFDTLPPGPVAIRCAPKGYDPTIVEAYAPQDGVLIVLEELIDLEGRVVAGPIATDRIQVRLEGSGVWPALTQGIDAEGKFTFPGISDGVYAIEAVAAATPDDPREFASIPLENVTPDLEITLALVPATRVDVIVKGPGGKPVEAARVTLMSSQIGLLGRVAETDADGRAAPGPVVPGPYVLRADADGYLPSEPVALMIEPDGVPEQTLTLSLPGRIEGIVVDASDRPVPGAFVSVTTDALFSVGEGAARADMFKSSLVAAGALGVTKGPVPPVPIWGSDDPRPVGNARADDDGRFVLNDLVPGRYSLQALHGDFAASAVETVKVRAGVTHSGIKLVLRSGWPLTGRVVDGNGRPVRNATVELDDGSSYYTDRRGTFDAGLRRGRQVLVARKRGLAPARTTVQMPQGPLDVELVLHEAEARLKGRVENTNGRPVENAQVTVQMRGGLFATRVAWTDDRGLWHIDDLPKGRADVDVEHHDYLPASVVADASRSSDPVDITLHEGWSVEVDVREYGSGNAIKGASVTGGGLHARTNNQGAAEIGPFGGERVRLEIRAENFPTKVLRVERPAGTVAEVAVDLTEGGSLSGQVTDYRGDPVPGSRVVIRDAGTDAVIADVRAGAGGKFRVDGIPEGDLVLEAFPPRSREDELAEVAQRSDVLRGRVTQGVDLRFDRR